MVLVTAAAGGTPSLEASLRQRTIAPRLSDRGFHFSELKNPLAEGRSASRRGRNLSERDFLAFAYHPVSFCGTDILLALERRKLDPRSTYDENFYYLQIAILHASGLSSQVAN